jgi:outer membrane protein assembly factor BamB
VIRLFRLQSLAAALVLARVSSFLVAAPSPTPEARDWPQLLGPDANGISMETGLMDSWPPGGPPRVWSLEIGTGYSAPSVRGNRLVLHHRLKDEEIVEAFEAGTGKRLWRDAYPSHYVDPFGYNNGPRCTPLLTADRCYTFGAEGRLRCLDLQTGRLIWERDTGKDWTIPEAFFGVGSSPILEGNLLIAMVGGQPNSGMVALDAATGATVWESVGRTNWHGQSALGWPGEPVVTWRDSWKQASYATPVAVTIHGKRHILCLMRQGLVSVDPGTGGVNFSYWFQSRVNDSVNAMNPVVMDDLIFISAAYYQVGSLLLRVNPDGTSVTEVWRDKVLEIHWTTPVLHEGNLYAFSGRNEPDARMRCVAMKTGKLLWDRDESWRKVGSKQPPVYGRGSAVLADNKLIVLGEGGKLGLFKVNSDRPEELSSHQVPELHYPCWAAPVLSAKRIYLRSEDHLVCFDLKQP